MCFTRTWFSLQSNVYTLSILPAECSQDWYPFLQVFWWFGGESKQTLQGNKLVPVFLISSKEEVARLHPLADQPHCGSEAGRVSQDQEFD